MTHRQRWLIGTGILIALAAALALIAGGAPASLAENGVIYVDADAGGANNGTSWTDAYTDLQSALSIAVAGKQIWVAEGTYKPTWKFDPEDERSATFQMKNEVAIYGGFDPSVGDDEWEERNWDENETILSGDIGTLDDASDNSYHVFYHPAGTDLDGTAILDGFTVTGGYAQPAGPNDKGGGMHNYSSSPALSNCTFAGNSAYVGGGMYNEVSSPTLSDCIFSGNEAIVWGGGMGNYSSSPVLTDCTFSGNSAQQGGGMANRSSSPALTHGTFEGNSASTYGGGMFNGASSPTLTSCGFSGNSAQQGGGMYNTRTDFVASSPTLTNCTFSGNTASYGGGMLNIEGLPALTNCTFEGNSAGTSGGGLYNYNGASPALTNSILWDNLPDQIFNDSSTPLVIYSDIQGGCSALPGNVCGDGNINADPLFVDPASGDYHLGPGSPCIDAATNGAPNLPPHDFEGDPRILDGDGDGEPTADMGVDEVWGPPPPVIFVDLEAAGTNSGTSWADAFTDLQHALIWAQEGVEIWVAAGTYTPSQEFAPGDPRSATFQMVNGVAILGGFDPSVGDVDWEDRDWINNVIILSGDIGSEGDPADNSYHVFYHPDETNLNSTAVLDGFTIAGGNADGSYPHDSGGGMFNDDSSPTLRNLTFSSHSGTNGAGMHNEYSEPTLTNVTFSGNTAATGGGMYNRDASPTLTGCTFSGNSASTDGGGMYNRDASPTLTGCTFSSNSASTDGGGMYNDEISSPALTNCSFTGNSAGLYGGGMYNNTSEPTVTNCTFDGNTAYDGGGMTNASYSDPVLINCAFISNTATRWGGAMSNGQSSPTLTNVTFNGNSAGEYGDGIYDLASSPTLTNCILWEGDTPEEIHNADAGSSPVVSYSDIQGGYTGTGNIEADPLFLDAAAGDLRLQLASPAIDAGDSSAPGLTGVTIDLGGNPRFAGVVDMGAYEAPHNPLFVDLDATGNNDGTSWEHALTGLQEALTWAQEGVAIWVAAGTYKPTWQFDSDDLRSATFQMKNGVAIYGGFDPSVGVVTFEDRDWALHETILSGDLDGDDGSEFAGNEENSYHVFYHQDGLNLDSSAILDGFTIIGGNANGAMPHSRGGGMYNYGSWPTLANCTFSANRADYDGGGLFNYALSSSSPVLTHCTFEGNSARYGGGVAIMYSAAVLTNCTFSGNSANDEGGGMYNWDSSPLLTDCTFTANSAGYFGGGMNNAYSAPTLINCTFAGNSADSWGGGGMHNDDFSSPALTDCRFSGNSAGYGGGGMLNYNSSSPALTNCTFSDNSASYYGGGMYNDSSSPALIDCTFSGNSAGDDGGGMYNTNSSPSLTNCTFSANSTPGWADRYGGGMYNHSSSPIVTNCTFVGNSGYLSGALFNISGSSPTLVNCILWADGVMEIYSYDPSSTPGVSYSDIQGGCAANPYNICGEGNIEEDPLFVDAANGDLHLAPGSPCIDAGTNAAPNLPPYDFEGDPRIVDGDVDGVPIADMGVDEVRLSVYLPLVLRNH